MDIQQLLKQVKNDPQMVQRIMQSPDGQKQMLTQSDGGSSLDQAASSANSGSTAQMVAMLKKVMQSPEGSALINRLGSQMQQ